MSEYILNTSAQTSKLDWAFPFQRTGAFPIDRSSIFSSLTDAKNYAKGVADGEKPLDERGLAGTSYVGQIISVYNESDNTVSLFIITPDRNLKEVGNSIIADAISVEVIDNEIKLKDFGKGYYSYVPSQTNTDGEIISESKYVYTEGFKEGLEPRVALNENNQLVLGWYEPSNENIEEISLIVNNLINEFEETKNNIGIPSDGEAPATGLYKLLEEKANGSDVYTKEEVYTKTEVLEKISDAGHLKRVKINSKDDINNLYDNNENLIYMIPTGLQAEDDKYDEYIVLDGEIEKVGSWEVDLSGYAKESTVSTLLDKKVDKVENSRLMTNAEGEKLQRIEDGAEKNFITAVDSNFSVVAGELNLNLLAKSKIDGLVDDLDDIIESLNNKVEKEDGSRLIKSDEINKLSSIKDLIKDIDKEKFSLDDNGVLLLNNIEITEIEGLVNALSNKVDKVTGSRLITKEEADKLEALSIDEDGSVGISASVNANKVQELYNAIVSIVTGTGTGKYDGEFKDLLGIEPGAEKNFITTVESDFSVVDGLLSLKSVPMSKVTGLSTELSQKANVNQIEDLEDYLNTQLTLHEERFEAIESRLSWKQI